jgi:UDP:flavonoid glycosyltransferase YjiC (YdhE family)
LGVRLDTYTCSEHELHTAIDRLLGDDVLRARLSDLSARIQQRDGVRHAADLIETLARTPARRHSADDTPTEPGRW